MRREKAMGWGRPFASQVLQMLESGWDWPSESESLRMAAENIAGVVMQLIRSSQPWPHSGITWGLLKGPGPHPKSVT